VLTEVTDNLTLRGVRAGPSGTSFRELLVDRMLDMSEEEERSRLWYAVRHILMSEWDPIGVSDTPEAADEYDGYLGAVCDLLGRKASQNEIAAYLREIETQRMGLTDERGAPLVPAKVRDAAVSSLRRLTVPRPPQNETAPRRVFRHWKLFSKHVSPAYAKTQQRREDGVCIGCGANPCTCRNPKRVR
jgi:hypothetical protein